MPIVLQRTVKGNLCTFIEFGMHFYAILCTFIFADKNGSKNSRFVKVFLSETWGHAFKSQQAHFVICLSLAHVTYLVTGTLVDVVY